ncbi:hypothetical protein I314_04180 [Cryptococcus bacillisporus CA1873]|uniref:YqaJ viral recombinase domain-containing protein n=1 Tax=Cryptococcus bacillisporus CA1873 TaxID=1296111 RepID=A0ABR5B877_CRYGA|nr:hypothetical protein I314_04180 [Cryptococcus bacillisporus CA1873]|eukprot:KIR59748.1 hypothetical protein I314_04180 [Cryptococcus gattii CA1873]
MSQINNSQSGSGRRRKSLPSRLPEDVYNTRMSDRLELEPPPSDEELDRYWSIALKRLWHREFRREAGYTDELVPNLKRGIETRTLDSRSTTFRVAVDLVPERPLSLVSSATMKSPYSQTKVKAAVDKWMPKRETAEEQEEEEDGFQMASNKAPGMSAGGMQPSTSLVKFKTTTSSLRRGIRRPDYVIEAACSHIAGSESTSVPLIIEIKAFPLSDSGHPQFELEAGKAFVRGLSQTAMYALAGWEMFRCRRGLCICGPPFCRVFVLEDTALAVEVASPPASFSALTFARLSPASNSMDLAAHARGSATMSKIANSDTGRDKKASAREGPYLEVRENRKDRGDGGGGSGRSGEHNRLNDWLETLRQAEKPTDIPSNGLSPPIPTIEDIADLAMDSNEYQELGIANILGDLGVHFVSVSSAQMDELFS